MEFKMKKQIFSAALVTAVCVASAPLILASKVEKQTLDIVKSINDLPFYRAEIVNSESGYLASSSEIKLSLDLSEMTKGAPSDVALPDFSLAMVVDVAHGPLLASGTDLMRFDIAVKEPEQASKFDWDKTKPLYQILGQYNLFGNVSYQDAAPEINYQDDQGMRFYMSAYQGQATTVDGKLTHQGVLPELVFEAPFITLALKNVIMDTRFDQSFADYLNPDKAPEYASKIAIEHSDVNVVEQNFSIELGDLAMAVSSIVDDAKHVINNEITYSLGSVKADDFVANNLEVGLQLNNLDEATFIKLNKLLSGSEFNPEPEQQMASLMTFFQSNLLTFLTQEPELNLTSVKGDFSDGHFEAVLNTKLINIKQLPDNLADMPFWLQHVDANSHIEVAKPLATSIAKLVLHRQMATSGALDNATEDEVNQAVEQQATGFIAMLESQGTLVAANESYIIDFELKENNAKLNGNAIPLPVTQ